jgi:hypothetical protein
MGYNSWGNGSAMRVAPVAYAFDRVNDVMVDAVRERLPVAFIEVIDAFGLAFPLAAVR